MLEIEVKYRLTDPDRVEERLRAAGAVPADARDDADHYLNAPDRDFARTDEALRLRRIGQANYLTYKGPRTDAVSKTRPEVEVRCGDGADAADRLLELFARLGYRPVAVVRKRRSVYRLERGGFRMEVCLDDVAGLGAFAELEIMAEGVDYEAARDEVFRAAAEFGLTDAEPCSYLELLLGRPVKAGGEKT